MSCISIPTTLTLYNTCILPIFLYGSECWAVTQVDARRIDALDHWCLRTLLGTKLHQFVRNEEVRRITKQPNLTAIIQSWSLSIFWHVARIDDTRASPYHVAEHRPVRSESLLHWTKQSTWLRTVLGGGWCLRMVLRSPNGASQERRRPSCHPNSSAFKALNNVCELSTNNTLTSATAI